MGYEKGEFEVRTYNIQHLKGKRKDMDFSYFGSAYFGAKTLRSVRHSMVMWVQQCISADAGRLAV